MKKIITITLLAVALGLVSFSARADAPAWDIDKDHAGIVFSIKHIYSSVNGHFKDFTGEIRFDPDNLGQSRFNFSVKVKSIDTFNTKRDNHLLSGDFFDADKYPVMTFKSSSIKHLEGNQYSMEGTMTVKDVSRTVTVPFTFFGSKPHPFNPKQLVAGFEARMTIDRLEYHVGGGKFLKMGVVGKKVDVLITIEAARDK
jgi:polyisoprenoid-binding protein YceI